MFALRICTALALFLLTKGSRKCSHKKQDVFVVVDGSRDVGSSEFDQVRTFLQDFVTRLNVGLGKTHVGLLVVSSKRRTKIQISLGQYGTSADLRNAIGRIKRRGRQKSDMAYALELVETKVFNDKDGDRRKENDVLIMFTDRIDPSQLEDVLRRADNLKKNRVEIITVYLQRTEMAWNVKDELTAIASIPQNVLTLQSNNKLRRTLKRRMCPSARAMHPTEGCTRENHDVFFVLDGSGSVKLSHFEKMQNFLVQLIEELDVGPQSTHVGLLQFSHSLKTRIEFDLGEHTTFEDVRTAILKMRYQEGGTDTGDALEVVNTKVFPPNVLYRPNVSDVVVILTDGEARDRQKAFEEAAKLRRKGVRIIAIGMGEEDTIATFRNDLRSMASRSSDVFTGAFTRLPYLVNALTSEICYATQPKAMKCEHEELDILFVVDGSRSVKEQNFKKVRKFLKKLVMELNVGENNNRVGLIQFSEQAKTRVEFGFNRYYEVRKIGRAINKMPYQSGQETMTGHALGLANDQIFTGRDGDRADAGDVVILVADGGAHDRAEALKNAEKLKKRGVHIVTIYIPNSVSEEEYKEDLRIIASSPNDFYTYNFNELKYIAADLIKVVCSKK